MMNLLRQKLAWRVHRYLGLICTMLLIMAACVPPPVNNSPVAFPNVHATLDGSVSAHPGGNPSQRSCPPDPKPHKLKSGRLIH